MTSIKKKIKKLLGMADYEAFRSVGKDIPFTGPHMSFDSAVDMMSNELAKQIDADTMKRMAELSAAHASIGADIADIRYNTPKEKHKASEEEIDHVLATNPLYQKANQRLNNGQRGQIGYGIDKYPEPLNADTWTIFETLDHIMDESIDKMHYMEMLREKFGALIKENDELKKEVKFFKSYKNVTEGEMKKLQRFKDTVEQMGGEPFKVYADEHLYAETLSSYPMGTGFAGADHDGDSFHYFINSQEGVVEQLPQSDINYWKVHDRRKPVEPEEDSTYIKMCKQITKNFEIQEKLMGDIKEDISEIKERTIKLGEMTIVNQARVPEIVDSKLLAHELANELERQAYNRHTTGRGF